MISTIELLFRDVCRLRINGRPFRLLVPGNRHRNKIVQSLQAHRDSSYSFLNNISRLAIVRIRESSEP